MTKADRYEPLLNESYEEMAAHYGTAIRELLVDLNSRRFKKMPEHSRRSLFEKLDKPALKPLPASRYEIVEHGKARVHLDYHVEVDHHFYSVPYILVGQQLDVRLGARIVDFLLNGKKVASHARSFNKYKPSTIPEHMPQSHRKHLEWSPGRFLNWANQNGPRTRDMVRHLLESRPHPEHGYRSCLGLLGMSKKFGSQRLEAACARALALKAPNLKSVTSILKSGLDKQSMSESEPDTHSLSFEERISLLVDCEVTARDDRKLKRYLRHAKFREHACVEDIDYRHHRGLSNSQMASFASCDWIRKHQNLCITGPTGTGKTFLACALGNQACRQGLSARYFRLPRLFESLRIAHGDGSFVRLANLIAKADLLVLDDWGLQKPSVQERNDLLEILEDRYNKRATLVTSQLPVKNWHGYLGDATMADAILDRLVHNAHKLQLSGDSMRKKKSAVDGA